MEDLEDTGPRKQLQFSTIHMNELVNSLIEDC